MKATKKTKMELVNNLKNWEHNISSIISTHIERIEFSDTVEEIMNQKAKMLSEILADFCMRSEVCYFCLKHDGCEKCKYGKVNGICCEDDSIYDEISGDINRLKRKILFNYPKFKKGE